LRCIVDPLTGYPLFFCYRALLLLGVGMNRAVFDLLIAHWQASKLDSSSSEVPGELPAAHCHIVTGKLNKQAVFYPFFVCFV